MRIADTIRAKLLGAGVVLAVGLMIWNTVAQWMKLPQSDSLLLAIIATHVLAAIALDAGAPRHEHSVSMLNMWERLIAGARGWLFAYCIIMIAIRGFTLMVIIVLNNSFAP